MNVGIIGSGMVAQAIGGKLAALGHQVRLGTRDPGKLAEWLAKAGPDAGVVGNAEAAAFGEILFNCTAGAGSVEALRLAGEANLSGKILIDVSNPLDFSQGMPPSLSVCNTDSVGEQLQQAFPELKVVKALNTVNCNIMVNPSLMPGEHDMFVSGNDPQARSRVAGLLKEWFGWQSVIDLGDITGARATEMMMPIWLRLMGVYQTAMFGYHIVRP